MRDERIREIKPLPHLSATAPVESSFTGMVVTCPCCCRSTDDLKSYDVPYILFLWVYVVWNTGRVTACPSCMRRTLLRRLLISIPLSNVLFPFSAVIYLSHLLATRSKGHSDSAMADAHRMNRDEQFALLQERIRLP